MVNLEVNSDQHTPACQKEADVSMYQYGTKQQRETVSCIRDDFLIFFRHRFLRLCITPKNLEFELSSLKSTFLQKNYIAFDTTHLEATAM